MQYFVTNFGILRKKKQPESHGFRLYEVKISVLRQGSALLNGHIAAFEQTAAAEERIDSGNASEDAAENAKCFDEILHVQDLLVERRKRNRLKLSPLYHSSLQNAIVRRHFYVLHNLKASSLYNYPKRTSPPGTRQGGVLS